MIHRGRERNVSHVPSSRVSGTARSWDEFNEALEACYHCFVSRSPFYLAALLVRDRLNIRVRPISPADELNVLPRLPKSTRYTVNECHEIVAVSAPKQCPRSFSRAELSHTSAALSFDLRGEVVRRVSPSDPRPVALVARGREAVPRAKRAPGQTALLASWIVCAGGTRSIRKRVPVTGVAVRYHMEPCVPIKVYEGVWLIEHQEQLKYQHTHKTYMHADGQKRKC